MKTVTTHKTFNKVLKSEIKSFFPNAKTIEKKHVAEIGYVYYVRDENNNTLGNIHRNNGFMTVEAK